MSTAKPRIRSTRSRSRAGAPGNLVTALCSYYRALSLLDLVHEYVSASRSPRAKLNLRAQQVKVARHHAGEASALLTELVTTCRGLRPRCEARLAELQELLVEADASEMRGSAPAPVIDLAAQRARANRAGGAQRLPRLPRAYPRLRDAAANDTA